MATVLLVAIGGAAGGAAPEVTGHMLADEHPPVVTAEAHAEADLELDIGSVALACEKVIAAAGE